MKASFNIVAYLQQMAPVSLGDRFIVAISGGVDSVVLAYLCWEAGLPIELAHCNFQLRGQESDRDEELVRQLAANWEVPVSVNKIDLTRYASLHKLSIQEAARKFRYQWFASLVELTATPAWILTAHHADDNAETVAMNFFKGTGLTGLAGIPPRNGHVLRPLLPVWRKEILQLAQEKGLSFVEDSSNVNEKYTRNFFRHTVIPGIEKVYPTVKENLVNSIRRFTEIETLYEQCIIRCRGSLFIKRGKDYKISIRALRQFSGQTILFELFSLYGFSSGQAGEIEKMLTAQTGAVLQAAVGPYRLHRNRNFLWLTSLQASNSDYRQVGSFPATLTTDSGSITFLEMAYQGQEPPAQATVAWLDTSLIQFPLLLRRWRQGDYFYPLGMRKKKKLGRFFIDQKLSTPEKENAWIVESGGKIIWVVGMRIDDRFKVTAATRTVCVMEFTASV